MNNVSCKDCAFLGMEVPGHEDNNFCYHPTSFFFPFSQPHPKIEDISTANTMWTNNARQSYTRPPYGSEGDHDRFCGERGQHFLHKDFKGFDVEPDYYLRRKK